MMLRRISLRCFLEIEKLCESLKPKVLRLVECVDQFFHFLHKNVCVGNLSLQIRKNNRQKAHKLGSIGFSLLLLGCSQGDMSDLNKYIAEVKARPKSAIEPLPEIKVVEPFLFNPEKLRDPFVAGIQNAQDSDNAGGENSGIRPDPLHQKEDLENYPLDALKMVGTVLKNSELWGLVQVEETTENKKEKSIGTIHRVKVGNFLGTNYGKILRISEDKIELMEIVPDKPGTWREQEQELPLVLAE